MILRVFGLAFVGFLLLIGGCSKSGTVESDESESAATESSQAAAESEANGAPLLQPKDAVGQSEKEAPQQPLEKKSLEQLIASIEPAIVQIDVATPEGGGIGSGFVIDAQGIVVTNHHVISGATSAKVVFADGTNFPVIGILGSDTKRDIAILKIQKPEKKLVSLKLLKDRPQKGQAVVAFGAPQGLSFSASEGIVSAVRSAAELAHFGKPLAGEWIQTTTPISPGNSGGPLVDLYGQVVGINTFHLIKGQNLNFAVSASDIALQYENAKVANPLPLAMLGAAAGGIGEKEIRSLKIPPHFAYDHEYQIASEKGKFDTYRTITLGPIGPIEGDGPIVGDGKTILFFVLIVNDNDRVADKVLMIVNSVSDHWRFNRNRTLKVLCDRELTNLGDTSRDYEVKPGVTSNFCIERLTGVIPLPLLLKTTRARSAGIAVGSFEHNIGYSLTEGLQDLLSGIPLTRTVSGIALEIDEKLEATNRSLVETRRKAQEKAEADKIVAAENERRSLEEARRFEIIETEKPGKSGPTFKVKLLSSEAEQLSGFDLSAIALQVSQDPDFVVLFFLPEMAITEKPWATTTRNAKVGSLPDTRIQSVELKAAEAKRAAKAANAKEKKATEALIAAKKLLGGRNRKSARDNLEDIVRRFPESAAKKEAEILLKQNGWSK